MLIARRSNLVGDECDSPIDVKYIVHQTTSSRASKLRGQPVQLKLDLALLACLIPRSGPRFCMTDVHQPHGEEMGATGGRVIVFVPYFQW